MYGNTKGAGAAQCYHGGGKIVWPLIQNYGFLDLKPMTININLEHALNAKHSYQRALSLYHRYRHEAFHHAEHGRAFARIARRPDEDMAKEIIFGQLRLTVASLTIEEINGDREAFLSQVVNNVDTNCKISLYLINVNITDITDKPTTSSQSVPRPQPKPSPRLTWTNQRTRQCRRAGTSRP